MKQQWLMAILLIGVSYFVFSQTNDRGIGVTVNGKNWDDSTSLTNVGLLAPQNDSEIFGALITARIKLDAKNNCGETTLMHYIRKITSPKAKEGIVFMARSLLLYWHI